MAIIISDNYESHAQKAFEYSIYFGDECNMNMPFIVNVFIDDWEVVEFISKLESQKIRRICFSEFWIDDNLINRLYTLGWHPVGIRSYKNFIREKKKRITLIQKSIIFETD